MKGLNGTKQPIQKHAKIKEKIALYNEIEMPKTCTRENKTAIEQENTKFIVHVGLITCIKEQCP